jgi:hypothetical protein
MQIVTVALAAIMCIVPTSTVLAQDGAPRNCQMDFNCFAQAAATCNLARVQLHVAIPLSGTELETTQVYEILRMEGDYCLFRSRVERVATRLGEGGVVQEQVQRQRQVIAAIWSSIKWLNVTCRFAPDQLTVMLDRWVATPAMVNADLDRPECTGGPGDQSPALARLGARPAR